MVGGPAGSHLWLPRAKKLSIHMPQLLAKEGWFPHTAHRPGNYLMALFEANQAAHRDAMVCSILELFITQLDKAPSKVV